MADKKDKDKEEEKGKPKEEDKKGKKGKEGEEGEETLIPKKPRAIPLYMIIFIAVNILIVFTCLGYIYYLKLIYEKPPVTEKDLYAELEANKQMLADDNIVTLDIMSINLLGGEGETVLKIQVNLDLYTSEAKQEIEEKMSIIKDIIIKILTTKRYEDIRTVQGKLFLKDQMVSSINGILEKASVRQAYFTYFLVI